MVYPTDDLAIRARLAILEARELVERVRKTYERNREVRARRRMDVEGGERPFPPPLDYGLSEE